MTHGSGSESCPPLTFGKRDLAVSLCDLSLALGGGGVECAHRGRLDAPQEAGVDLMADDDGARGVGVVLSKRPEPYVLKVWGTPKGVDGIGDGLAVGGQPGEHELRAVG